MAPADLLPLLAGEDLDVATPMIANLHNRFEDQPLFDWKSLGDGPLVTWAQEVRSHFLGHVGLLGTNALDPTVAARIANVATRTELVLLMRDALYRICEMNANGVLSDEKAEEVFRNVLSTARTLGQRDNVGKLIDVLAIVAAAEADRPKLVESLVSTIRLIALGDQLIQTDQGASGIATALTLQMMLSEIGSISDAEIKKILTTALVQQIEKLTKQRSTSNAKEIDRSIEALKSLGMSMGLEPEALKVQ